VDLHRVDAPPGRPRLLLLHGLEGSLRSHYVSGTLAEARRRGWGAELLVFRSCGDEPNRLPRFYHSGETEDVDFVVNRLAREHAGSPLGIVGVSLGGNVLLKWLGERGAAAPAALRSAVAVSAPYDLARGARHISRGFSRVYEASFLRSLRRKAREKLTRYPRLVDAQALARVRTIEDFDDAVTAPVHGFASAAEYYARSSAIRFLEGIRVPTLLLSARDDPFLPAEVLDEVEAIAVRNRVLETEFSARGGHVGFVGGRLPWRPFYYMEWRSVDFLARHLEAATRSEVSQACRGVRS
jgi:predicted alpha/beta-fold hydrolase